MKTIKITKMQGCGNDFVVLDFSEFEKTGLTMSELAKKLCDRNFGVGADGMIIPDTKPNGETDIAWYFYNSDGSTAQMCGNGMRCFAKYVYDNKLVSSKSFSVKTLAGVIKPQILDDGNVKVNMGTPILEESKIPFKGEKIVHVKDKEFHITPVSMGNPPLPGWKHRESPPGPPSEWDGWAWELARSGRPACRWRPPPRSAGGAVRLWLHWR